MARAARPMVLLAALLALLVCHCGGGGGDAGPDGDGPDGDGDADADGDAEGDADEAGDGAPDGDVSEGCEASLLLGTTFEVAPDLADTQIHPAALFDGEAVWVAFNLPEASGSGRFDVHLLRLGCDGSIVTAPVRVNTTEGTNDIDPDLALSGDRVLAVWQGDSGAAIGNVQVYYRLFGLDGVPLADRDSRLQTTREGEPFVETAWMSQATALPSGGFAIAGSRGVAEASAFQVFVQRLDAAGGLVGETIEPWTALEVQQTYPAVAASGEAVLVAWPSEPNEGQRVDVLFSAITDGPAEPEAVAPEVVQAGAPSLAVDPEDPDRWYLAFHVGQGRNAAIRLVDVARPAATRPTLELGDPDRIDNVPTVATGPGGGAVAWFQNVAGMRNHIVVQAFSSGGGALEAGNLTVVDTVESAPALYGVALTHVVGTAWLVVWAEGTSPAFRLYGRFVDLAP